MSNQYRLKTIAKYLVVPATMISITAGFAHSQQTESTDAVPGQQLEEIVEDAKDKTEIQEVEALGQASYNIEDCRELIADAGSESDEGGDSDSADNPEALDLDKCKALVK